MTVGPQAVPADRCYRHPDRQSWVLCQRCGRTICPECQTQAAVGVHCPECVAEARQSAPRRAPAVLRAFRPSSSKPVVTYSIMAVAGLVFLLQQVVPGFSQQITFYPLFTVLAPWTLLTAVFAHASIFHIGVNLLSLYLFGPSLEQMLGRIRYLVLFLLAGLGGSVAVMLLAPTGGVLGASGAVFGLFGAFFVIMRGLGGNATPLLIVIALNLAMGFFFSNVSWQAHVGGLIVGSLVALVFMRTRRASQRTVQVLALCGIAAALVVTVVIAYNAVVIPAFLR